MGESKFLVLLGLGVLVGAFTMLSRGLWSTESEKWGAPSLEEIMCPNADVTISTIIPSHQFEIKLNLKKPQSKPRFLEGASHWITTWGQPAYFKVSGRAVAGMYQGILALTPSFDNFNDILKKNPKSYASLKCRISRSSPSHPAWVYLQIPPSPPTILGVYILNPQTKMIDQIFKNNELFRNNSAANDDLEGLIDGHVQINGFLFGNN